MYLQHFGLDETPFRITPHTDFFFAGANRGATLDALIYAILHDQGIVKVSGEVGSGKTMLSRMLAQSLPDNVDTIYLANPMLTREEIVFALADELQIPLAAERPGALLGALQAALIERHAEGRHVVALIDEAHAMPPESLEQIRLLSNLETSRHKLLQIVLFGQPELDEMLARDNMRQLKDRITHSFRLEPLVRGDISEYIDFRMRAAGYRGPPVFAPSAIRLIAKASSGLTRRINILADKSLLAAFAAGAHQVLPAQVRAAVRDSDFPATHSRRRWLWPSLGAVATLTTCVSLWGVQRGVAPVQQPSAVQAERSAVSAPPTEPVAASPAAAEAPFEAAATPTVEIEPELARLGPEFHQRLAASREWQDQVAPDRWFVQLATAAIDDQTGLKRYLSRADTLLDGTQLRLFTDKTESGVRVGIIYGDFPSAAEARSALTRIPEALRNRGAYVRQASAIKRG